MEHVKPSNPMGGFDSRLSSEIDIESIHAEAKLCICVPVPVGWGDAIAIIYCIVFLFYSVEWHFKKCLLLFEEIRSMYIFVSICILGFPFRSL